jgi:Mg-chelatase subunit ChlI
MRRRSVYPFTAIVGQERMKRALVLNAINPSIGGVLIRGERGTAKSTAARALAALLPEIHVVADCRFGCDPDRPDEFCDECRDRIAKGETLPRATRQTRIVDLPVSATEDRVVGTLDIEKAIKKGERHFDPGVLAAANRGILYVDEVNLLDDHVVDLLLDSAAMGINVVEREGISFQHPARFILVGTMNPEEGDLRPQLLDRFALSVDVHNIADARDRMTIVKRHIEFDNDPEQFRHNWVTREKQLSDEIARARQTVDEVAYDERNLYTIAALTSSMNVDGHRADLVILKAARANAALEDRTRVTDRDITVAAELALAHRLKRGPLADPSGSVSNLQQKVEQMTADWEESTSEQVETSPDDAQAKKKVNR